MLKHDPAGAQALIAPMQAFLLEINHLHELVKKEWIAKGNQEKKFRDKGPKIIVILDNASYHKRLDIRTQIIRELPNIVLEFLPDL